jgi:hypothetical protein
MSDDSTSQQHESFMREAPIWFSPTRSRVRCGAWLRPARSPFPERTAVRFAVIGTITLHLLRPLARASTLAADRRDALNQSQQLRDVVPVRSRQTNREWDAPFFYQQMVLAAEFAAIYGAFAGLLAPVTRSHAGTVNHAALPRELPFGLEFREDALPQPVPDAPRVPFSESAAASVTRGEVARRGEAFPRHPGLQNEDDAGHHLARISWLPTGILNVAALVTLWEQRLDALPQVIGEDRVGHTAYPFV